MLDVCANGLVSGISKTEKVVEYTHQAARSPSHHWDTNILRLSGFALR